VLTYEDTMKEGAAEYADVVAMLRAAGFPAGFTQTGGMNAAIESVLDGGGRLLVTDREDSLAWSRAGHVGWAVGVYPVGEGADPLGFGETADGSTRGLSALVDRVFREVMTR